MRDASRKLRRKKKEKSEPLTFEGVLKECTRRGFKETAGEELEVKIESISFERFEEFLGSVETGMTVESFSKIQETALLLFIPEEQNIPEKPAGNLPILYFLEETAPVYAPKYFLTLPKPYAWKERKALLWQTSGSVIYKASGFRTGTEGAPEGEGPVRELYICSGRDFEKNIRKKIEEPEFEHAVRTLVFEGEDVEGEQGGAAPDLEIAKPREFCLGTLFLPLRAVVGKKRISCLFKRFIPGKEASGQISGGCLWYRFSFQAAERTCSIFYGVDVKGRTETYNSFFAKLFQGMLKTAGNKLRVQVPFSGAKGGVTAGPKEEQLSRSLVFEAEIGIGRQRIQCIVAVDRTIFGVLARRLLEPSEGRFLQHHTQRELLLPAGINRTILSRNIDRFYTESLDRDIPKNGPPGLYGLRVSEFINLLDDDDVKRIMQNYFIGSGFAVGDMQRLFFFKVGPDENDRFRITIDPSFDNSRFANLLPRVPREEWKRIHGVSETYRELLENNAAAMQGIYNAVSHDKLLLSFKSRHILDSEFREKIEGEYLERIDALLEEGEPLRSLKHLTRETAQQVVSAMPTKKLAVALLARTEEAREYGACMSRNKRQELAEEIRVQKRRRDTGQFTAELIYDYLLELRDTFMQAAEKQKAQQS